MWIDKAITFLAVRQDILPSDLERSGVRVDSLGKKEETCSKATWTLFPNPWACVHETHMNPFGSLREWQSCPMSQTWSTQKRQRRSETSFQSFQLLLSGVGGNLNIIGGGYLGSRQLKWKNGPFTAWVRIRVESQVSQSCSVYHIVWS